MKLYLPTNLDIDQLIYDNPRPSTLKPYKRDKLLYIIHLLSAIPLFNKDLLYEEYIPINAQTLQSKIQNYRQYLDYLINDLKIIESNYHYIVGHQSIGYRLTEKYRTTVEAVSFTDRCFYKTLKTHKNKKDLSVKHLKYLTKWFNDGLEINLDAVMMFLAEENVIKNLYPNLRDYDRNHKKYKKPINQYNHAKMSAEKLSWQDYYLMLDDNVYRFHSNLTNMRSVIRNAVTYNGQKLISIDIKNSQPYLSTVLLNRRFWITVKKQPKNDAFISLSFDKPQISLSKVKEADTTTISIDNILFPKEDSNIMLGEMKEAFAYQDFSKYIQLVVNGELYEYLEEVFLQELGVGYTNRKQVKAAIFQVLFTDNRFLGQEDAKPKQIFKKLFPEEYDIFSKIKKNDKTVLPRLLQSIESYLIVDVICKRIASEYPDAPIFTIHDSIATTEEYVDAVEHIMKDVLSKAIGYPPTLQRDNWELENMDNYIAHLKEKAKIFA
jgi:hypothetical protein